MNIRRTTYCTTPRCAGRWDHSRHFRLPGWRHRATRQSTGDEPMSDTVLTYSDLINILGRATVLYILES
jgi:hypothetical protein